eukprot:6187713-Pleurochrysis_carterae.AAC.3
MMNAELSMHSKNTAACFAIVHRLETRGSGSHNNHSVSLDIATRCGRGRCLLHDTALVGVGHLSINHNLADNSLHLECILLLLSLLAAHVGAQPAPALPASVSRVALNAAAVDAGIAVFNVCCSRFRWLQGAASAAVQHTPCGLAGRAQSQSCLEACAS